MDFFPQTITACDMNGRWFLLRLGLIQTLFTYILTTLHDVELQSCSDYFILDLFRVNYGFLNSSSKYQVPMSLFILITRRL